MGNRDVSGLTTLEKRLEYQEQANAFSREFEDFRLEISQTDELQRKTVSSIMSEFAQFKCLLREHSSLYNTLSKIYQYNEKFVDELRNDSEKIDLFVSLYYRFIASDDYEPPRDWHGRVLLGWQPSEEKILT
jgi:hypothetical protein